MELTGGALYDLDLEGVTYDADKGIITDSEGKVIATHVTAGSEADGIVLPVSGFQVKNDDGTINRIIKGVIKWK